MKKTGFLFLFFAVFFSAFGTSDSLNIAVITDVHFLSKQLAEKGGALRAYEQATGRGVADLHEALDAALADIVNEKTDVLLISGDLTNHGERQSHLDFIEKLRPLKERGVRVFVIPGNHDVNVPDAKSYAGAAPVPTPSVSAAEFASLYAPFGYADALKRDSLSLSYLAAPDAGTWLLCFDTNRYDENRNTSVSAGRIRPQTLAWALEILREAREKNITVLGMMHHGLVEHLPYQSAFFPGYLVENWQKNAEKLADAGLKVVFTGHFHSNDVSLFTSPAGNRVYDVETASLAQYPFAYRIMRLKDKELFVDTRFVTKVTGNPDLESEYRQRLQTVSRRVAQNRLRGLGMSFPDDTLDALAEVIAKLNLLHVRGDEAPDEEIKRAVRDFARLLGSQTDLETFSLDFPPEDNRLIINVSSI